MTLILPQRGRLAQAAAAADPFEYVGTTGLQNNDGSQYSSLTHTLNGTWTGGSRSSLSQNDIVLVGLFGSGTNATSSEDGSTWTQIFDLWANDTSDTNLHLWGKRMGATPDTSVTFTLTNTYWTSFAVAISGADTTTWEDVTATTATGTNSGRPNPPAITPVTTDAMAFFCGSAAGNNNVNNFVSSDLSDFNTGGPNSYARCGYGFLYNWSSGALDPAGWTGGSTSTQNSWCAGAVAIRPA